MDLDNHLIRKKGGGGGDHNTTNCIPFFFLQLVDHSARQQGAILIDTYFDRGPVTIYGGRVEDFGQVRIK